VAIRYFLGKIEVAGDVSESGRSSEVRSGRRRQRLMNYYLHHVPGRLRVKIPGLKTSPEQVQKIRDLLDEVKGVKRASVNTITGSVLILYDTCLVESEEILMSLQEHGDLDEARAMSSHEEDPFAFSKTRGVIGKALFGWFFGKALENVGLSFLSALI
jgi:hypothetical protein